MTITLPLQPQEEARPLAAAQAKGVSTDDLLREALDRIMADSTTRTEAAKADAQPIWEAMLNNFAGISSEEFAKLPRDGASQPDHYFYGHPKRDQ